MRHISLPSNMHMLYVHTAAHIGLESDVFHIDEGEGLQRFPVSRSGSVNGVNKILCKLKPIDATAQITDEERADFVVPRTPETVTFQPFNTTECTYAHNIGRSPTFTCRMFTHHQTAPCG